MDPISCLPEATLRSGQPVSDEFLRRGVISFREACQWVKDLSYGSNTPTGGAFVLFADGQGTCFTKHGTIARLARELELEVHKNLGFYRLTDDIVTGAGTILRRHGLGFVPTMHCFLESGTFRVDLTEGNRTGKNRDIDEFDFVVRVAPDSSREALQRYYADHFDKYCALEPRLAALGREAVRDLVTQCHQQASCRCSGTAELSVVALAGR
jgi:hypothetical protein